MVTTEKYVKLKDILPNAVEWNVETVEFGTAEWRLSAEGEYHVWTCEHCGHVGGRGWEEPKYKFCSGCGYKMIRRNE